MWLGFEYVLILYLKIFKNAWLNSVSPHITLQTRFGKKFNITISTIIRQMQTSNQCIQSNITSKTYH